MEEWKDVVGYEGFYQVSNEGRVRSLVRLLPSAHAAGIRKVKQMRALNVGYAGRLGVILSVGNEQKRLQVHRMVLEAFVGPCPEGMEGLHNDNNHLNNRVGNLRWGTHTENMHDKWKHGTMPQGEKHSNSKLTDDQVRAIRLDRRTSRAIAADYGVSQVAVVFIKNRKTWKYLD